MVAANDVLNSGDPNDVLHSNDLKVATNDPLLVVTQGPFQTIFAATKRVI